MKRPKRACRFENGLDIPASVELVEDRAATVVLNQGERGTCVAHSVTTVHMLARGGEEDLQWEDLHESTWEDSSSLHAGNRFIGALIKESALLLETKGQRGRNGSTFFRMKLHPMKAGDVELAKARIAGKHAIAASFEVFCAPRVHLTVANHKRLEAHDREQHAVALVGYNVDESLEGGGRFTVLNSHGRDWGDQGFGSVSFAFYELYCREAFFAGELLE